MSHPIVYDIFCDASVGPTLRTACPGALCIVRGEKTGSFDANIQHDGTNNSGELGAVYMAVSKAAAIQSTSEEPILFNIFSDSMLAIKGVREWLYKWFENMNGTVIRKESGEPVMNQGYIKLIFNTIIINRLNIRFYHQKGHVNKRNIHKVRGMFLSQNGISLDELGLTDVFISECNNIVDQRTRMWVTDYLSKPHPDEPLCMLTNTNWHYEYAPISTSEETMKLYRDLTHGI